MTEANSGTSEGLQEFLDWAGRTGEMNPKTAEAWATACRKVLSVEEDLDNIDLRTIDIEALADRFERLYRTAYSAGSMNTYRSRFRRAVAAYLAWLNNEPMGLAQKPSAKQNKAKTKATNAESMPSAVEAIPVPDHGTSSRLIPYTVPLRRDLMVSLTLPVDLSTHDADRIAQFVKSLAFTNDPSPSPSREGGHEER